MNKKIKIILLTILTAAFILLAAFVTGGYADYFNAAIYQFISPIIFPELTLFMKIISNIGEWFVYAPFILILIIIPRSRVRTGIPITAVLLVSALVNQLLKALFQVSRPDVNLLATAVGYGFPSGHTMNATSFVLICTYLFFHYSYKRPLKIFVAVISLIFLVLIGFSRIYLGVHNPTDVIGGYIFGCIIFGVSTLFIKKQG